MVTRYSTVYALADWPGAEGLVVEIDRFLDREGVTDATRQHVYRTLLAGRTYSHPRDYWSLTPRQER